MVNKEIHQLDVLFSEYIRRKAIKQAGGCERCLTPKFDIEKENGGTYPAWKQLQCSHFFGRAKKSVRWDEENVSGLCGACHIYFTSRPLEHYEWFKQRLGEIKFDLLNARAWMVQKPDKAGLTLYYTEKIKELMKELKEGLTKEEGLI